MSHNVIKTPQVQFVRMCNEMTLHTGPIKANGYAAIFFCHLTRETTSAHSCLPPRETKSFPKGSSYKSWHPLERTTSVHYWSPPRVTKSFQKRPTYNSWPNTEKGDKNETGWAVNLESLPIYFKQLYQLSSNQEKLILLSSNA